MWCTKRGASSWTGRHTKDMLERKLWSIMENHNIFHLLPLSGLQIYPSFQYHYFTFSRNVLTFFSFNLVFFHLLPRPGLQICPPVPISLHGRGRQCMLPVGENVEWDINLHKQCLLIIFINIIFTSKDLNALFQKKTMMWQTDWARARGCFYFPLKMFERSNSHFWPCSTAGVCLWIYIGAIERGEGFGRFKVNVRNKVQC